jgi:hypothetical protein
MSNDAKNKAREKQVDPVAEATAQAAAGATTDMHEPSDLTDGRVPDPDLAQGESA